MAEEVVSVKTAVATPQPRRPWPVDVFATAMSEIVTLKLASTELSAPALPEAQEGIAVITAEAISRIVQMMYQHGR